MARKAKPIPAAVGFRVKSGWAMAVLLTRSTNELQLVICRKILLSDPKIPQSVQPYHAALDLPEKEAKAATQKLTKVVRGAAAKSIKALLGDAEVLRYKVRGAGLVVGSLVDPATLHNEHIRAHGLEGQLFRLALEDAMRAHKIRCAVWLERSAYEAAAPVLRQTLTQTKRTIANLGKSHHGSWRSEEKLAALAAWAALSVRRRDGVHQ
jgi:hypothetical protein